MSMILIVDEICDSVYERNDERAFECCDKDDCVECVKMNGDNCLLYTSDAADE